MKFSANHIGHEQAICDLFTTTFTASEGPNEGAIIGQFVKDLMATTPPADLLTFAAHDGTMLVGCIFFSRLTYPQDDRTVFLMSPVAVRPDRQKQGIGQKLITFGLDVLRQKAVEYVITYGDPAYYSKTGFHQISTDFAQAPCNLTQPQGWLGQSLRGKSSTPLVGPSQCVPALNRPELW